MIHPDSKVLMNSRAVVDACRPYEWMSKFPEVAKQAPSLGERFWPSTAGRFSASDELG